MAQDRSRCASTGISAGCTCRSTTARSKGFYKDEGIDLTINEGRGSANTVQVVAAGSDTFGLADSSW